MRHSGDRIDSRSSHRKNNWTAHKFPPRYPAHALTRLRAHAGTARLRAHAFCTRACGRSIFERPDIGRCGDCEELLSGYGGARGSKHVGLQGPPIRVRHRKVSRVARYPLRHGSGTGSVHRSSRCCALYFRSQYNIDIHTYINLVQPDECVPVVGHRTS